MATAQPAPFLPVTMVGSYPRPHWFNYQLLGRDVRVAFKHADHAEPSPTPPMRPSPTRSAPAWTSSPTARCASTITSG